MLEDRLVGPNYISAVKYIGQELYQQLAKVILNTSDVLRKSHTS